MIEFLQAFWQVVVELAPWLLVGAFVGGVLHVVVPGDLLQKQLSGPGGVAKAVILGVPLPLCSCGVIPVGLQLKKSGASDGPVVAFLISTPQTGADSIFVSGSLLGWPFAFFKVASAAFTGLVGGWLTEVWVPARTTMLPIIDRTDPSSSASGLRALIVHSLDLLHSIWRWLLFGIAASALIEVWLPPQALSGLAAYGGLAAMLVALLVALPMYVCATASVPIASALVSSGLPTGAALVFLMAGPATNVATLGAVYRALGRRALAIYLLTILGMSIALGWAFDFVLHDRSVLSQHVHRQPTWWGLGSGFLLLGLMVWFALRDGWRRTT